LSSWKQVEISSAIAIVSDGSQPPDIEIESFEQPTSLEEVEGEEHMEEGGIEVTELEECILDIAHVVKCLYEFSVTIRNPAPQDRFEKCSA
jgi:hypothetical protein